MMTGRIAFAVASAALASVGLPALAQPPEAALPRVIYGTDAPAILYGPPSAPPEARAPARPAAPPPQAAPEPPPAQTTIIQGWIPIGPPAWDRPRHWRRRPPPIAPPRDPRFEPPLPMGTYLGRPPSASMPSPRRFHR